MRKAKYDRDCGHGEVQNITVFALQHEDKNADMRKGNKETV